MTRRRMIVAATLSMVVAVVAVAALVSHNRASSAGKPGGADQSAALGIVDNTATPSTAPPTPALLDVLHDSPSFKDESGRHAAAPPVEADTGIVVDIDSHTIIWERNPHTPHAPASTTKVLSSLVALQNFDPDKVVTITPDALIQAADETRLGLQPGQQMTVRELLTAMLMVSANDAATALAIDTIGLERYVASMNEQAAALGLKDSHFTTPVGLDDPLQRSSAYDLAILGVEAYDRFPLFRQLVGLRDVSLPASAVHPQFDLHNLNRLLEMYPAAVGIKPGWTGDAGACLIGMAARGGHRLVAVVMGAPKLYTDEVALFDWAFGQYGLPPLVPPTPIPTPTPPPQR